MLFERSDKITAVVKAAFHPDIGDRQIGGKEHLRCLLNPVIVHIIKRCLVGDGAEETAEIFGVHAGFFRHSILGNGGGLVILNIFQYCFQLVDTV